MSEPKFTKGPWKMVNMSKYTIVDCNDKKHKIAILVPRQSDISTYADFNKTNEIVNEMHCNGWLIAAAPDMYALLEKLQKGHREGNATWQIIENVLKKARGERYEK